jgi:hypothetical protein
MLMALSVSFIRLEAVAFFDCAVTKFDIVKMIELQKRLVARD